MSNLIKRTLSLPKSIRLWDYDGKPVNCVFDNLPDTVLEKIIEVGARTILTNVRNGGGKAATDAEKHAAVLKKLDAWAKGEFNVVDRGESAYGSYREVWLADCLAAGMTSKAAEDGLKAKVAERLGKDTKATFANFLEATAIEVAEGGDMTRDEARDALEAYYAKEADERAKAREAAKVAMPKIDLSAFKKQPTA